MVVKTPVLIKGIKKHPIAVVNNTVSFPFFNIQYSLFIVRGKSFKLYRKINQEKQDSCKRWRGLKIIRELGPEKIVAIGNGSNDVLMLREAALGIGVIGEEGCSKDVLKEADLVVKNVIDALSILLHPERIVATLRY